MDLSEVWKSFVMDRIGDPPDPPPLREATARESAEALWTFVPLFRQHLDEIRGTPFDDAFADRADILVGKVAFREGVEAEPPQAWRIVWERYVCAVTAYTLADDAAVMVALPSALSEDDRARAIWLRDLLGPARDLPADWPGRKGPATVLEFPSGAPWRG